MTDNNGRKVIYYDDLKDVAIVEDSFSNDYLIVSRLSTKDNVLIFNELIKYCKNLDHARLLVQSDLFEV